MQDHDIYNYIYFGFSCLKIFNMIKESFSVKTKQRMIEVNIFIKENMPTCRHISNPYCINDIWYIYISYEIQDINKLNSLQNKFYKEDSEKRKQIELEKTIGFKIKKFFKKLSFKDHS
jgi:hypothetical protein